MQSGLKCTTLVAILPTPFVAAAAAAAVYAVAAAATLAVVDMYAAISAAVAVLAGSGATASRCPLGENKVTYLFAVIQDTN